MIITLPSESHIHHISSTFLSHVHIPSKHYTSLWQTLFKPPRNNSSISLFCVNSFEILKYVTKAKQKRKIKRQGKRKEKKKEKERNRRSEKKENKLEEYLLFSTLPSLPFPSIPTIHHHPHHLGAKKIIISGTTFAFKNPFCLHTYFAFNHIIPLDIVSLNFFQPPQTLHPKIGIPLQLHFF